MRVASSSELEPCGAEERSTFSRRVRPRNTQNGAVRQARGRLSVCWDYPLLASRRTGIAPSFKHSLHSVFQLVRRPLLTPTTLAPPAPARQLTQEVPRASTPPPPLIPTSQPTPPLPSPPVHIGPTPTLQGSTSRSVVAPVLSSILTSSRISVSSDKVVASTHEDTAVLEPTSLPHIGTTPSDALNLSTTAARKAFARSHSSALPTASAMSPSATPTPHSSSLVGTQDIPPPIILYRRHVLLPTAPSAPIRPLRPSDWGRPIPGSDVRPTLPSSSHKIRPPPQAQLLRRSISIPHFIERPIPSASGRIELPMSPLIHPPHVPYFIPPQTRLSVQRTCPVSHKSSAQSIMASKVASAVPKTRPLDLNPPIYSKVSPLITVTNHHSSTVQTPVCYSVTRTVVLKSTPSLYSSSSTAGRAANIPPPTALIPTAVPPTHVSSIPPTSFAGSEATSVSSTSTLSRRVPSSSVPHHVGKSTVAVGSGGCPPETLVTWCRHIGQTVMSAGTFGSIGVPRSPERTRVASVSSISPPASEGDGEKVAEEEASSSTTHSVQSPKNRLEIEERSPSQAEQSPKSPLVAVRSPKRSAPVSPAGPPSTRPRRTSGGTYRELGVHRATAGRASASDAGDAGLLVVWRGIGVGTDEAPTTAASAAPTSAPTAVPTPERTAAPTVAQMNAPTSAPMSAPRDAPTDAPTSAPTAAPVDAGQTAPAGALREARVPGAGSVWVLRAPAAAGAGVAAGSAAAPPPLDAWPAADATLRARTLVLLWALLGEQRLSALGFPSAPVDALLWRSVRACCAAQDARSAAARPLPADHACGRDASCFRDHAHRLLEVCAPTRALWKLFGWAGLTLDAVYTRVYASDVLPVLQQGAPPPTVRLAMALVEAIEQATSSSSAPATPSTPIGPGTSPAGPSAFGPAAPGHAPASSPLATSSAASTSSSSTSPDDHDEGEAPQCKRKRGRPAKSPSALDAGRVERVMLWRFLLDLLEEEGDAGATVGGRCVRWVRREDGLFRVTNSEWLARLWGRRHGNPLMTYEKMARAMRTYYRTKVLQPVPRAPNLPRKLLYKFNPAVLQRVAASKAAAAAAAAAAAKEEATKSRKASTSFSSSPHQVTSSTPPATTKSTPKNVPHSALSPQSKSPVVSNNPPDAICVKGDNT